MPPVIRTVAEDEIQSWVECIATAFLERSDTAKIAEQLRPYWDPPRAWGAFDGRVVGTLRSFASELTVPGGAHVPATAVAAVTVLPTYRRRGILRGMISAEHVAARERGEVVAMLHASEAVIYGRFGYGVGVVSCEWTLTTPQTSFVGEPPTGVAYAEINQATARLMRELHERHRTAVVGEIQRQDFTFESDIGLIEFSWDPPWKGWVLIHRDPAGEADGYVRYGTKSHWEHRQAANIVNVQDFVALNDVAYDALWRFVADIDLVTTVRAGRRSPYERLPWLLTNRRALELGDYGDSLWVSLLDIPAALEARSYLRESDLVIEVIDAEPSSGRTRVRLEAAPDGAACSTTRRKADLTVHADALGAAFLGGTSLRLAALARGFEEHRPGALAEADSLLRTLDQPRCTTFF